MANNTPYGLANAARTPRKWRFFTCFEVYSADAARCARVAGELKSGVVWENCSQAFSIPFKSLLSPFKSI